LFAFEQELHERAVYVTEAEKTKVVDVNADILAPAKADQITRLTRPIRLRSEQAAEAPLFHGAARSGVKGLQPWRLPQRLKTILKISR
jgi:hypothetical protein